MIILLLSLVSLATAGITVLAVVFFTAREREWRERERLLIDRLLKREGHQPIVMQPPDKVLKLPDPEALPPMEPGDLAFYQDDLLEDLQYFHGLGHGMTPEMARQQYPAEWQRVKQNYDRQHQPLRVE